MDDHNRSIEKLTQNHIKDTKAKPTKNETNKKKKRQKQLLDSIYFYLKLTWWCWERQTNPTNVVLVARARTAAASATARIAPLTKDVDEPSLLHFSCHVLVLFFFCFVLFLLLLLFTLFIRCSRPSVVCWYPTDPSSMFFFIFFFFFFFFPLFCLIGWLRFLLSYSFSPRLPRFVPFLSLSVVKWMNSSLLSLLLLYSIHAVYRSSLLEVLYLCCRSMLVEYIVTSAPLHYRDVSYHLAAE